MAGDRDPRQLDDGELVLCIAAGPPDERPAAEAELCRRLSPRVRVYGLRHLRDPVAVADLAQDVLLMVIEKLRAGAIREPPFVGAFVLGICRQMIVDQRRTRLRRERLLDVYQADLEPQSADIGPALDAERLRACLEELPERDRSVLVMSFFAEQEADAVGAQLGLTAANVRVIRHRAVIRMRGCMGFDGQAP
jgi:RNA polymerase sigma-70 factor, ECF subfamily